MDEQEATDQFVALCGGAPHADRLSYLWSNSYPGIAAGVFDKPSKVDVFKCRAEREGFTTEQVEALLLLQ
ncbi:MAG TPA: hypothetical protein ENH11_09555 [Candidatus Acetothermia bacterium]|nr:hypothetical protein [Candidatus Acetothermia bacterium]